MNNKEFTKKYYIDRNKSNSIKWQRGRKLGCLPMWVADMDFKCDEKIIKKLEEFISFGDYGYTNLPEDYYKVFCNWHKERNNVTYKQEWIRFTKGAVDAMYQILYAFTEKDDYIMINTPLYPPFKASIKETGRKVVESKLINTNGYFTFDYADIEKKFKSKKVKMLMLCSPHNPVGRVWKKGELEELFDLCKKYKVLICSDEVHSDIIMPDQKFIPSLSLKNYQNQVITITAASKSFSLAVYSHCHVIIANEKLRNRFIKYQQKTHSGTVNAFNALPTYYGYKYGRMWMDSVNNVIFENYNYVSKQLGKYMEMSTIEGSYLLFLNLGKYNTKHSGAECLIDKCKILANPGESFDKQYHNWVRLNLATSLDNVKKAVKNIKTLI